MSTPIRDPHANQPGAHAGSGADADSGSEAPGSPHASESDTAPIDLSARDAERWPDVAAVPSGAAVRLRATAATWLFRRAVGDLDLRVEFPDGTCLGRASSDIQPRMIIRRPRAFARRVGAHGLIGFGEAFMAGDWTTDDLVGVLTPFAERAARLVPGPLQSLRALVLPRQPADEDNSTANTRSNIARHYDLSNDLFAAFLDETLTYSSALFAPGADVTPPSAEGVPQASIRRSSLAATQPAEGDATPAKNDYPQAEDNAAPAQRGPQASIRRSSLAATQPAEGDYSPAEDDPHPAGNDYPPAEVVSPPVRARWDDLPNAQRRKIDRLLDLAGVGPGTRVLEIGTGWGELCLRAAARGATVRSVTLSSEQRDLARQRVADAGFADRVTIDLCDYRQVDGTYDAVVSVEMIEAVGESYWPVYFSTIDRLLAPGGRLALQAITMPHDRMLKSRNTYTWVHKYIFPGGQLPSLDALHSVTQRHTSLRPVDTASIGAHYAETLRLWRERFISQRHTIAELGFDPTFMRMWQFYLAYSEAGFRSGYLDVHQMLFTRETP